MQSARARETGVLAKRRRALLENTELDAESIVRRSLAIAGELCIYTNQQHLVEVIGEASSSEAGQ